jgi:hypothetical protein
MNTEKLLVVFKEVEELKDRLKAAIAAAGELRDMNSDSENVKTLIKTFSNLDALAKKKIDDINTASSFFVGQTYAALAITFVACSAIGVAVGYLGSQKAFTTYIEQSVLRDRTAALVNEELRIDQEKQQLALCYKAQENHVKFFNNAIELPVSLQKMQTSTDNKATYFY